MVQLNVVNLEFCICSRLIRVEKLPDGHWSICVIRLFLADRAASAYSGRPNLPRWRLTRCPP